MLEASFGGPEVRGAVPSSRSIAGPSVAQQLGHERTGRVAREWPMITLCEGRGREGGKGGSWGQTEINGGVGKAWSVGGRICILETHYTC